MPTQSEYNVVTQNFRLQYIKINLLNFNFQTVDELSGVTTKCIVTIDSNSDIRRICNVDLVVTDSSFNVQAGGKIFLDKYIQVFTGVEDIISGEIVWTNQGIFLINNPNYDYNATTNTLSFQGIDLMSKLTGMRNGQLVGVPTVIPANSIIRNVIISILALGGFNKYTIADTEQLTPYEIKVEQGGTIYDVLRELCNILSLWEMFFDVDGVFHFEPIPSGANEPVVIENTLWQNIYLSHKVNTNFENVKNLIEVYGKTHQPNYVGSNVRFEVANTNTMRVVVNISTFPTTLNSEDSIIFGFRTPATMPTPPKSIETMAWEVRIIVGSKVYNCPETKRSLSSDNTKNYPHVDTYYVAHFIKGTTDNNNVCDILSEAQAIGEAQDNNPDSPFYINGSVGTIREVKVGGEYDVIYSNTLCEQRARYELYLHSSMQDTITLNCVSIPWLDVNKLVEFSIPNENIVKKWIVKNITTDYSVTGTQSIVLSRYYPLYPTLL